MICPWFVDIEYWYKNDPYVIIYKISQLVYFKYSILTNHGHIINFTKQSMYHKNEPLVEIIDTTKHCQRKKNECKIQKVIEDTFVGYIFYTMIHTWTKNWSWALIMQIIGCKKISLALLYLDSPFCQSVSRTDIAVVKSDI